MRASRRLFLPASLLAAVATAVPLRAQPTLRSDTLPPEMVPVTRAPGALIAGTRPTYPPMLRSASWEGTVVLDVTVDSLGAVVPGSLRLLQHTHYLFALATRQAAATWRFEPATAVDSAAGRPRMRPVAAPTRLTVSYRLVSDSAAVEQCQAAAPVTRVCALQQPLIRTWVHE